MQDISAFLSHVTDWATAANGIAGVLLVGSFARGTAHAESDVDLVIMGANPDDYLTDIAWLHLFGEVTRLEHEDWGLVQSLRVFYQDGLEVEFGLTAPIWAEIDPLDEGTRRVVADGAWILVDKDSRLAALLSAVHAASAS